MKPAFFTLLLWGLCVQLNAQSADSVARVKKYSHRDSLYTARLNYTGNLMIAGGVGLAAAGSFLIYEGVQTYRTPAGPASTNPAADVARNHSQGTAYIAAGAIAYVGTAVLIGLGIRNKLEFKRRKKRMELQSGIMQDGNLGAMLNF